MSRTPEQKARHAAKMREYRKNNPESHRAAQARWRGKKTSEDPNWRKRYYLENRDKILESINEWKKKNRERCIKYNRRWRASNKDHIAEYNRRRREEMRAGRTDLPPLGEVLKAALSQDALYAAAAGAVPRTMPDHVRDDIISEIVIAVLEGDMTVADISDNVKRFVTAYWSGRDFHRTVSLDATISGTDNLRLGDIIASDAFHL